MSRLLNGVIAFALHNRLLIVGIALSLIVFGSWTISELPIDVFPDLNRPRVVVITEAHGLAPEEVETLVTYPLEAALNGANGVQAVRSSSGVGISVIYVEFDWGTKILDGRQVVDERISLAAEQLPPGIQPQLAPISSIMGQISIVGMYSQPNARSLLFRMIADLAKELDAEKVPIGIKNGLRSKGIRLSNDVQVLVEQYGKQWTVLDKLKKKRYTVLQSKEGVEVHSASSTMELRTYADWVVRQQLRTVEGVAQVFVMGGDHKQYQVLVKPRQLLKYGVTLHEVEEALRASNQNATGGYLDQQGPNELLVRVLGRISSAEDLTAIVIDHHDGVSVTLGQVAEVIEGAEVKRGDAAAFYREEGSEFSGGPAVVLTINKQPGGDTRKVTEEIEKTLEQIQERLPGDIVIKSDLYQQSKFIDLAIDNVVEALTHGALLVVIVLFLFLFNIRTTFITLTAIPLSIVITGLVFYAFGQTINTMTLGGIAVAIGELVDDAIVDVENIFRRLRENKQRDVPLPAILVVFRASVEVRNSIVFGTLIVVLVFLPLFALSGMEGRLFAPLGVAYIVSIFSSLFVSLTVTPVLSYWLLRNLAMKGGHTDSFIVRALKWLAHGAISLSVKAAGPILIIAVLLVAVSGLAFMQIERDFLPPFDEGAVQVNILMPPGTSLRTSTQIAVVVDEQLLKIPDVLSLVRKTGRAEADEHAEGVNVSEMILAIDPNSDRNREEVIADVRKRLGEVTGIEFSVEQPLAHLISHMLSGVKAQVAIKLYGDDLDELRRNAQEMKSAIENVKGVRDLQVEPQVVIPQLRIEVDGQRLKQFGLTRLQITEFLETAMNGHVVSEVIDGQQKFDILVRLDDEQREDLEALHRLVLRLPDGGQTNLGAVAKIYRAGGPNTINRERTRRRIVLQCNVSDRGLVDVVEEIQARIKPVEANLPTGYFVEYGGQFKSQQRASRVIAILFVVSLFGMFLVLYTMFRSVNLSLQIMVALPMAFVGGVAALMWTGQTVTIAAMVGFISLGGIASRNGILLINHYLHLVKHEGEDWTPAMIIRAGKERLSPVLMTALTSGIGLVPLAMAASEPGKEILHPVAIVIVGGLISSTILEFFVRPALFWQFGIGAARNSVDADMNEVQLTVDDDIIEE